MRTALASALTLSLALALPAADWPQFRGPHGTGVSDEAGLPATWGRDANVAWKVRVPGYGWSSPVVAGDKVFVTTATADGQSPPPRKGPGGGPKELPDKVHRFEVHCLAAADGTTLWSRVAAERKPPIATHVTNPYAAETPVTDGRRVYAYFGMVGVFCYDLDGTPLWTADLGSYRMFGNWGTGSSPALADGRLFVQCDNEERSFVVALDAATGKELWRVARPERSTWGTPVVWRSAVRTELVLMGTKKIRSYDPVTGKVLWELTTDEGGAGGGSRPAPGGKAAAGGCKSTPVATREMIYVGMATKVSGRQLGPMWAVKAGAAGDVSLRSGEKSNAHVAWYRPDAGPHFASALVHDGLLYVYPPHDGVLRCFDAATGADVYQQKLAGARDFKASPWAYGGTVFAVDETGVTFAVTAGRAFAAAGTSDVGEPCWASPAPAGGALFVRTVGHVVCVRAAGQ